MFSDTRARAGKKEFWMCVNPVFIKNQRAYCACGKCLDCKMQKTTEWAFRIAMEASLYDKSCFVTLTYNDDNLPVGGKLDYRDVQLFLKRLRKKVGKVRFFCCGEYGKQSQRPHYHIVFFGYVPEDLVYFFTDEQKDNIYKSQSLADTWNKGFVSVGINLNLKTAKYCAKYMQKDNDAFLRMSLKPGIGYNAFELKSLVTDKIYIDGKYIKIPRYFLDKLKKDNVFFEKIIDDLKANRKKRAFIDYMTASGRVDWGKYYLNILKRAKKYEQNFNINVLPYKYKAPKRDTNAIMPFKTGITPNLKCDDNEFAYARTGKDYYLERYSVAEFEKILCDLEKNT